MQYQLSDGADKKLRRKFLAAEVSTYRIGFKYLDIIHRVLKNSSVVIIVISLTERHALMVGIGLYIYGFMINGI